MTTPQRTAASLALVPFTALGLARFAYGLLLPSMRAELGWTYAASGMVTTANAVGYLVGAMLTPALIARRISDRRLIVGGIAGVAISLAATGLTTNFELILFARFGAGLLGGIAFVAAGALAAHLSKAGAGSALVWYPAGAGAAIAITALGLPPMLGGGDDQWPQGWFLLAGFAALSAAVLAGFVQTSRPTSVDVGTQAERRRERLLALETSYALFGLGYIAYVTFVVAYLRANGASTSLVTAFWALLGVAGVVATFGWPKVLERVGADRAFVAALALCASGVAVAVLSTSLVGALVSAALFGGSFLAVVSTVTSAARDATAPERWTEVIARLTIAFGAGQIFGPLLAGLLGDSNSGLRLGLLLSAATLAVASLVAVGHVRVARSPMAVAAR